MPAYGCAGDADCILELILKPEITLSSIEKSGDPRGFRTGSGQLDIL